MSLAEKSVEEQLVKARQELDQFRIQVATAVGLDAFEAPEQILARCQQLGQSISGLEIASLWCLSMAHMTKEDAELLDTSREFVSKYREGFFVWTGEEEFWPFTEPQGYSDEFLGIIDLARSLHILRVRFDSDGPVVVGLPVFDW